MSTYSQIYLHVIFAVKGRDPLIHESWENELYKYITGIIENKEQTLIAINGMPDHIHLLIRIRPSCSLSDLIREIKKSTNEFIKMKRFTKFKFNWQEGFAAFSYSQSQVPNVIEYIKKQKEHHKQVSFMDEYVKFLELFNVQYDKKYL